MAKFNTSNCLLLANSLHTASLTGTCSKLIFFKRVQRDSNSTNPLVSMTTMLRSRYCSFVMNRALGNSLILNIGSNICANKRAKHEFFFHNFFFFQLNEYTLHWAKRSITTPLIRIRPSAYGCRFLPAKSRRVHNDSSWDTRLNR